MVGLGDLPGGAFSSRAYGVSADGSVVVGQGRNRSNYNEAFRWTAQEGMRGLGFLPGHGASVARAVSADTSVVVGASSPGQNICEAFRWEDGEMVGLGDLPGGDFYSYAYGVSADGSVVVGHGDPGDSAGGAFRWTAESGMVNLGDIPGERPGSGALAVAGDGSIVVGRAGKWGEQGIQAFIWDAGNGMRSLKQVLVDELDLDLSAWELYEATGISGLPLRLRHRGLDRPHPRAQHAVSPGPGRPRAALATIAAPGPTGSMMRYGRSVR